MKPHRKINPAARCCCVCGRLGGAGFTQALRNAGYDIPQGSQGHAHPLCMARAMKRKAQES